MRFHTKIDPAFAYVNDSIDRDICRCLVPIVPIYMIESWMLADKQLLKSEIGTSLSDVELRINIAPESCSTPKDLISDAIRIARQHLPQRRRKILPYMTYILVWGMVLILIFYQGYRLTRNLGYLLEAHYGL